MKPRVILALTIRDGVLHRTKRFVPDYLYCQRFVGTLEADEVVMVDVGEDRQAFYRTAANYAKRCFSPLTLGGHVRSVDEAERLLELGADKVLVAGWRFHGGLLGKIAGRWGAQVLVAGLDHFPDASIEDATGGAEIMVEEGAGEILLTSVERDGSLEGYDLDTLQAVVSAVDIPVIVSGGCGSPAHMERAFRIGAAGAATTNIHAMPDASLAAYKRDLRNAGIEVRA